MKRCDICLADLSSIEPKNQRVVIAALAAEGLRDVCDPCGGMLDELGMKIRAAMRESTDALLKRVFSGMRGFVRDVAPTTWRDSRCLTCCVEIGLNEAHVVDGFTCARHTPKTSGAAPRQSEGG